MQVQLTANVARAVLLDYAMQNGSYIDDEVDAWSWWMNTAHTTTIDKVTFEVVDKREGNDSDGDEMFIVFKVTPNTEWEESKFYTVRGMYRSYGDSVWGVMVEAKARTKTIIEYY